MESKPMRWSELRERVNSAYWAVPDLARDELARLLDDIDAAAPAMERQERDAEWARSMRKPPLDVEEFYRD